MIGFAGVEPGDLDLIAPFGTVNFGDAGARASGDLYVAALVVLNADNIKVSGDSKGVPKAEAPTVTLSVETKDKVAADAVKDASQQNAATAQPSVIIVEVLGYGGGDGSSEGLRNDSQTEKARREEEERRRRRSDAQGYDASSPYQVIGLGPLSDSQIATLAAEKRRQAAR